jgi:hypothetical protein
MAQYFFTNLKNIIAPSAAKTFDRPSSPGTIRYASAISAPTLSLDASRSISAEGRSHTYAFSGAYYHVNDIQAAAGIYDYRCRACVQLRGKDIIRRKTPIGNRKIRRKNVGGSERYLQPLPGDLQEAAQ